MSSSSARPEGITNPPIDELIEKAGTRYQLVIYAAKRAREINAYYGQLDSGSFENTGPLLAAERTEKPMSIALREIEADLLNFKRTDEN